MPIDTFTTTILKTGRFTVPFSLNHLEFAELRFKIGDRVLGVQTRINRSLAKDKLSVALPQQVVGLMSLPAAFTIAAYECTPVEPRKQRVVGSPIFFNAMIQGSKLSKTITLPMPWARGVEEMKWASLRVELRTARGRTASFATSISTNNQNVSHFSIPSELAARFEIKEEVHVVATSATFQAPPPDRSFSGEMFDVAAVLPDNIVVEEVGKQLLLTSSYAEPIQINRYVPMGVWCYLLGIYQAEGNKEGLAFAVPQKNPQFLRDVLALMTVHVGVDKDRFVLDVIKRNDNPYTDQELMALYGDTVGIPVRLIYDKSDGDLENKDYRPGRGTFAANLTFREGVMLQRIFKNSLDRYIDVELQEASKKAAIAFGQGFLDGDGTILFNDSLYLHVAGDERELRAALASLERGFEWQRREASALVYKGPSEGIRRRLDLVEMVDLATTGAFRYNLARARLLHTAFERWKNSDYVSAAKLLSSLQREYNEMTVLYPTRTDATLGKGHSYALQDEAYVMKLRSPWLVTYEQHKTEEKLKLGGKAHQRVIREEQAKINPEQALPYLDGCYVKKVEAEQIKALIETYEWLGDVGKPQACYALFSARTRLDVANVEGAELLGAVCFGQGPGRFSHDLCGSENRGKAICLTRGACVHWAPKNAASFLIRRACRLAHEDFGWAIFFAYADETAGEIGTVYQASNWGYIGQPNGSSTKFVSPDGEAISSRAMRARTGKGKAEVLLAGWTVAKEPKKHKYVWFEGEEGAALKDGLVEGIQLQPYPKRAS